MKTIRLLIGGIVMAAALTLSAPALSDDARIGAQWPTSSVQYFFEPWIYYCIEFRCAPGDMEYGYGCCCWFCP